MEHIEQNKGRRGGESEKKKKTINTIESTDSDAMSKKKHI